MTHRPKHTLPAASTFSSAPTSRAGGAGSGAHVMGKLSALLNGLLVVAYPLAVYFGLLHLTARTIGGLLLLLLAPSLMLRLRGVPRPQLLAVLRLPLGVLALVALAAVFDDRRFVLALPVLINLALLYGFGTSLRATPMVERYARLQSPMLSPAQVHYCRQVTKVWIGFFLLNASASAALAFWGPVALWALYTGLIAYGLIGLLASTEYIVRKYRFREYGTGLHDRFLARLFPPPEETR